MSPAATIKSLCWLIQKDLTRELRAHDVWPGALLLGLVIVFLSAAQLDLPFEQKAQVGATMFWLAVAFAGTLALERSLAIERDDGCWQTLAQYPVAPSLLFIAKMAINLISLALLGIVLVPIFIVLTDIPLLERPGAIALIAALGSTGFAAVGTLVSGVTANLRSRGGLIALLLLPLATPIVLASAEATSMTLAGEINREWWLWIQFLAVFAIVFTVVGALIFEVVMED